MIYILIMWFVEKIVSKMPWGVDEVRTNQYIQTTMAGGYWKNIQKMILRTLKLCSFTVVKKPQ